ncbi:MAG: asparagine synthase (glutamine-hydrolyzing), partial [Calditrichaeota bacterium]
NHLALREELMKKGHRFKSKADTEAIVHAYEEYGEECPAKLNGMFGFAILDLNRKSLFLARDRLGIKPLYYYCDGDKFAFGSELKSILQVPEIPREVDLQALDLFLTVEYIPSPHSIFKGISKLPPGHTLTYRDGQVQVRQYWELQFDEREADEDELCEELVALLRDAVKIRLMSDVPLGAFLSGGIDSSSIVALMSQEMNLPVKTFSISFKESSYNEAAYARTVAQHFGTEHHEFTIEPDALELTEKLIGFLDEPFGDFSIFPTFLVSQMARQFVTVALSGDGGDELFAGYDTYVANMVAQGYRRLPGAIRRGLLESIIDLLPPTEKKKGLINRAKRFVEGARLPEELEHTRWMIFLQEAEKARLYSAEVQSALAKVDAHDFIRRYFGQAGTPDRLNRQLFVDIKTYLVDDILVKVDRMSMATSLEARVPFLDHRFVEFTARIPSSFKLRGKQTKHLLKRAMSPHLPEQILKRGKEGFSIPIKNWLKVELKDLMLDVLSPDRIAREGFFQPHFVQQLIHEHLSGKENHSHRIWAMMVFGIWQDVYLRSGRQTDERVDQASYESAALGTSTE